MAEAGNKISGTNRKILQPKRRKKGKPVFEFVENGFNTKVKLDSPMLLHHGELYTIGDIIRITGEDDIIYYGEILQFWSDAYTEKFVTVQWLIPKMNIGQDGLKFIPAKYTHGPVHTDLINVRSIGFVMNAAAFGASPISAVFNTTGEWAVLFNSNLPNKTSLSPANFELK